MKVVNLQEHCFAVEFSPFITTKLACATADKFGLSGNGCLYIIENQKHSLVLERRLIYEHGIYDLAWSEFDEGIITTVSNDGCIQIWNIFAKEALVKSFKGHECEVNSVVWNLGRDRPLFATGSWDNTIKVWDPNFDSPSSVFSAHKGIVYGLSWSPQLPGVILSCSGDGDARTWDLRANHHIQVVHARCGEVLSCDWTKYESMVFVTCGTDSKLKIWDLRRCTSPLHELTGHEYPARRVKASPHKQETLASVSYDRTTRIWNYMESSLPIQTIKHHTEFVTGLDFNLQHELEIVDCSWDRTVKIP